MSWSPAMLILAASTAIPLLVAAASGPPQAEASGALKHQDAARYDGAPSFDGSLPPGTVAVARQPVRWSRRDPGWEVKGRTSDWPAAIERRFIARLQGIRGADLDLAAHHADLGVGGEWESCKGAYRAVLPGGVGVYVVHHGSGFAGRMELSVVLHRPATGEVSRGTGSCGLLWSQVVSEGPRAFWSDIDGDGSVELGFQLHHHNGTASDGGFIRWLRITDDLDLEEVHVSRLYDWVSVESRREEGFIRYRLLRDPDGTLRDEAWFETPSFGLGPVRVLDHSLGVPRGGERFSYR